ncbi:MAG: hypothetical protein NTW86_32050 [Candidatus Sumerlaeota bacterium]|nr:hypothetical protein [Candidatus Sumerlaeota bacterium]
MSWLVGGWAFGQAANPFPAAPGPGTPAATPAASASTPGAPGGPVAPAPAASPAVGSPAAPAATPAAAPGGTPAAPGASPAPASPVGAATPPAAAGTPVAPPTAPGTSPTPAASPGAPFQNPFGAPTAGAAPAPTPAGPAAPTPLPTRAAVPAPSPAAASPPPAAAAPSPPGAFAPGSGTKDPFSTTFGGGVTAVTGGGPAAPTPGATAALPTPAAGPAATPMTGGTVAAAGFSGALPQRSSSEEEQINKMRVALAAGDYGQIKSLADEYALAYPQSKTDQFFMGIARVRQDTLEKQKQLGSFLGLAQLGSLHKKEAAEAVAAAGAPASGPAFAPVEVAMAAPGAEAGAPGAAAPVSPATPAAGTTAPQAAPPPALPAEELEKTPAWVIYAKQFAVPAGLGAGGLLAVIAILVYLRRRKPAEEEEMFKEALGAKKAPPSAAEAEPVAEEELEPELAPSAPGGLFEEELETGIETGPLAPEPSTEEFRVAAPFEPTVKTPVAPRDEFSLLDAESVAPQAAPAAEDELAPSESRLTDTDAGLLDDLFKETTGAAEPQFDLETFGGASTKPADETLGAGETALPQPASAPSSEIDDLLSFIPTEAPKPPTPELAKPAVSVAPPEKPEESTSGITLSDLELPDILVPPPAAPQAKKPRLEEPDKEESTGGLSLEDLAIPEPTPTPFGGARPSTPAPHLDVLGLTEEFTPPPAPSEEVLSRTEGFARQYEDILFETPTRAETRPAEPGTESEESTAGESTKKSKGSSPSATPSSSLDVELEDTKPSERTPPPGVGALTDLEDTKVSDMPEQDAQADTAAAEMEESLFAEQMAKGREAMGAADYQRAIHCFTVATSLRPDDKEARNLLSEARRLREEKLKG